MCVRSAEIGCSSITYEIVAGNDQRLFTLHETTGLVLTSAQLDRETRHQHRFTGTQCTVSSVIHRPASKMYIQNHICSPMISLRFIVCVGEC